MLYMIFCLFREDHSQSFFGGLVVLLFEYFWTNIDETLTPILTVYFIFFYQSSVGAAGAPLDGVPSPFYPKTSFWGAFWPKRGAKHASGTISRPTKCIGAISFRGTIPLRRLCV